ncbi:hypothetical protein MPER_06710, partial [Moniliophthora perniciosa FA553]
MASVAGSGSKTPAFEKKSNVFQTGAESSPILDFSSPHAPRSATPEKAPRSFGVALKAKSSGALSGSDDELPDISTVLKAHDKKANLAKLKRRYVQETKTEPDDDDLEIIPSNAQLPRRAQVVERKVLPERAAANPLAKKTTKPKTIDDHNKELLARVRAEEAKVRKKKEEEWVQHGGKLVDTKLEPMDTSVTAGWKEPFVRNHLEAREAALDASEARDEDESDEDWAPREDLRGSAAPEPDEENENEGESSKDDTVQNDIVLDDTCEAEGSDVDEDPSNFDVPMKTYRSHRSRAMVGSDTEDENDENAIRRQSISA